MADSKIRVAIYGASGYTGLELLKLLARHQQVEVTALTTRQEGNQPIREVHPSLGGTYDLCLEQLTPQEVAKRADAVFTCLPHAASAEVVASLLAEGLKVVDFSADYRITDREVYETWYGVTHPDPERIGKTPYGLPELYRDAIKGSSLVANPGCYPTAAILGLAPLLKAGVLEADGINIDAKSGVSGAGRNPKPGLHFPEANENLTPYGVGSHRHMPEIDQVLSDSCGKSVEVLFTPHLIPMDRGELCTCYGKPAAGASADKVKQVLKDYYADEPFVEVVDLPPSTKQVTGTNRCHVYTTVVRGRILVISVIDNLIKGASGAAVQNFNLIYGFPETTALL